jgi:hypothetical protein
MIKWPPVKKQELSTGLVYFIREGMVSSGSQLADTSPSFVGNDKVNNWERATFGTMAFRRLERRGTAATLISSYTIYHDHLTPFQYQVSSNQSIVASDMR